MNKGRLQGVAYPKIGNSIPAGLPAVRQGTHSG